MQISWLVHLFGAAILLVPLSGVVEADTLATTPKSLSSHSNLRRSCAADCANTGTWSCPAQKACITNCCAGPFGCGCPTDGSDLNCGNELQACYKTCDNVCNSPPKCGKNKKRSPIEECHKAYKACIKNVNKKELACLAAAISSCEPEVDKQLKQCLKHHSKASCNGKVPDWTHECAAPKEKPCKNAHFYAVSHCNEHEEDCLKSCID